MPIADYIPGYNPDPYKKLVAGLQDAIGPADALALLPYDDGTFFIKRAHFDKNLIGGIGGYETEDGDKIAVDGTGEAVRELFGVPMLLAVDPTEHAAAVDPIKALIAHKRDIGEWVRVDKKGDVVQVGPSIEPAPSIADAEEVDAAMQTATARELLESTFVDFDPPEPAESEVIKTFENTANAELLTTVLEDFDAEEYDADELQRMADEHEEAIRAFIREELREQEMARLVGENEEAIRATVREYVNRPPPISPDGVVADGGMVGEYLNGAPESLTFEEAAAQLAEDGRLTQVVDIAPPGAPVQDTDGSLAVEEATHIAVDQSKAAELMPKTWDTVEINTALDKARMEEHEEGKFVKYMIYGIIIGGIGAVAVSMLMLLVTQIGGGIF